MSDSIRLSSVTVNCPDTRDLAGFYAKITGGEVTFSHPALHLDFLVDDLVVAEQHVVRAGAVKMEFQPNSEHCLVFADPVGHPFCLTTLDEIG